MQRISKTEIILLACILSLIAGCGRNSPPDTAIRAGKANIYPDYTGIVIPVNMAPLNFKVLDQADSYLVHIYPMKGEGFWVKSGNGKIILPEKKWKSLLQNCRESQMQIDIFSRKEGKWLQYESIVNQVVSDSIDGYLVYRLIEPGFETWNKMGIYQRHLESFQESPVMLNEMSGGNCLNCHSFASHSQGTMMFHSRAQHAGTIIVRKGKISKVNTKTDSTLSSGVYPSWHPGGRYIAFSVNSIVQSFHALPGRRIEVIDTLSDLILYDAEKNYVIKNPELSLPERYETFPSWSPDGRYLYFSSAPFRNYRDYDQIRYDLLRISFDAATESFGKIDTVIPAQRLGFSISFPRISPDGKYLLYTKSAYGSFTIWHDDADLELFDLESGQARPAAINSKRAESYHTWSSSGRWLVFSSRREDGLYTRLYFSYFDKAGNFHKPFLLPQRDPGYNAALLKSYNVPELITAKIELDPRKLSPVVKSEAKKVTFKKIE